MQADLIAELRESARELKVSRNLPPHGQLTDEQIAQVRDDFARVLDLPGVTADRIGQALGEGYSANTLVKLLEFESRESSKLRDPDRIARGVNAFLELIGQRAEGRLPRGFVKTAVAERMLTVIERTAILGFISVITGPPGVGKTMAIDVARSIVPGSVVLRIRATTKTPSAFIHALAAKLRLYGTKTSSAIAEAKVIEHLAGTGRLLILDEANRLPPAALEVVRDLHDEAGVGVVLVGTVEMLDTIDCEDIFGQLSSRIGMRYDVTPDAARGPDDGGRPLYTPDEVERVFMSSKVRLTGDGLSMLTRISNLPGLGGLRLASKVVYLATGVAGDEPIDARLLRRALRKIQGDRAHRVIDQLDTSPTLAAATG
ncbi:MAG: AAA family ATPase [Planctomycetota bacterium]